ncbi:hypothetical protein AB8T61_28290, partial [Klebsiella pneumoniae]
QNDVTLKMPAFEWVHVQLHQQKGMISLSPPTICNSAENLTADVRDHLDKLLSEMLAGNISRFIWLRNFEVGNN